MRRSGVRSSSAPPPLDAQPFSVGRFHLRAPRGVPGRLACAGRSGYGRHDPPGSPLYRPLFSRNLRQLPCRGTRRQPLITRTCARVATEGYPAGLEQHSIMATYPSRTASRISLVECTRVGNGELWHLWRTDLRRWTRTPSAPGLQVAAARCRIAGESHAPVPASREQGRSSSQLRGARASGARASRPGPQARAGGH